jgi:hypothetical protein
VDYFNLATAGFDYADEPVLFDQRVGHCFAHCMLWIGYTLGGTTEGYWQELRSNGATLTSFNFVGKPVQKITAPKGGDPLAGTLQKLAMSADLKADFAMQAAWASAAIRLTMSPSFRSKIRGGCDHGICSDNDPCAAVQTQKAWLFCLHKLTIESSASSAGGGGVGLVGQGGAKFTHHAVATMMYQGKFRLFDPNCGQFSVSPKDGEKLVEAWWDDVKPDPPTGAGYHVYNKTESVRSTVAGASGGALELGLY